MKTHERIALATRLYDVRCDLEVLAETIALTPRIPESLRDGMCNILEDSHTELTAIENLIRPELWETEHPVVKLEESQRVKEFDTYYQTPRDFVELSS